MREWVCKMSKGIRIAIDGPAAAGKSTTAKMIAKKLSYIYIDTGAMYRSLTYKALENQVDLTNGSALAELLKNIKIELKVAGNEQLVYVDGEDVTKKIRDHDVTNAVSQVAAHRLVREEMVKRQQQLAKNGSVVMDGRDIGTEVIPEAELKIFLVASVEKRAKRRHDENIAKGYPSDLETIKDEIQARDKLDSEREVAPLKKAEDAIEIDTSTLSIDEVVDRIMTLSLERIDKR